MGRRLFYTHLLVGLALALAVSVYFYFAAEQALDSVYDDRLAEATRALGLSIEQSQLLQPQASTAVLEQLTTATSRDRLLSHAVIYDSGYGTLSVWAHSGEGTAPAAVQLPSIRDVDVRERVFELDGEPTRTLMPLSSDRLLLVSADQSELQDYLAQLRRHAAVAFIFAVLISALMSGVLARDARRVLKRFARRCQQIAEGRFKSDEASPPLAEFAEFADSLETMAARLERTDRERTAALEQAKSASGQLEANVRERTAELDRLNVLLRKEIEQRCQLEAVLAEAAATDPLTRLLNRRGMLELLEQLADRTHRQRRHFCVAIVDIDHFKLVNDRYGHAMGDRILAAVAERLRTDLKSEEEAARWGGEEFLLVWPELPLAEAEKRAQVLRLALGNGPLVEAGPKITLSFGLAEYSGLDPLDACLVRADRALYRAKEAGRNRVMVS